MDTLSVTPGTTTSPLTARKPVFRPLLQPRAAAALDFNDDSDDSDNDFLSADYKAQRKTTMDLVDFFKNAPPPPPAPSLPPVTVDDKKKRTLLQRLRNRKSGSMLNGAESSRANLLGLPGSTAAGGAGSTVSSASGATATLPNGKKYVMIAVDYKDSPASTSTAATTTPGITSALAAASPKRNSPTGSKRQSRVYPSGSDDGTPVTGSTLLGSSMHTTFDSSHLHSTSGLSTGGTGDTRRSIILQAGGGEGSSFILDNSPFLLDNFALDTDFILPSSLGAKDSKISGATTTGTSTMVDAGQQHRRTQSQRSGYSQTADGGMSRRGTNKVTFNIAGQQQGAGDEDPVSKALAQRIANHKAQLLKNQGFLGDDGADSANESGQESSTKPPEVTLPKPISRKKVRHVQIQTQHCIMRPMYTQTEPMESLVRDSEPREFSTQTSEGSCEMGTSTELDAAETASIANSTATGSTMTSGHIMTAARATSKVASLVASLSQPTTLTGGIPPSLLPKGTATTAMSTTSTAMSTTSTETLVPSTPLTTQEHEELLLLRQKNASLQAQVITLQRDLSSEMRARTRTAVAMQDTRDKFEMLSAIAYKKIKEMIFQRHVLEMEVRELRAQVDMHAAEDAAVSAAGTVEVVSPAYRQHHHHHHQQHHGQQQSQHSQQHSQIQQHHSQHHYSQQQQYVSVGHY
ncbi:MAG: hypothetical protein JOS17DRAFT_789539 [Linnemannia elongata]|nr:MAG: hypothetical protein JOS17DRAFT_789539 [Linnemannia elongata]